MRRRTSFLLSAATLAAAVALSASPESPERRLLAAPSLRFIAGSSAKVEQLVGEQDKERHQPTPSRTESRYGIEGTDLGYSFEHDGRVYFLFGDTVGTLGRALDTIATTDARDPEAGVRLDFLRAAAPPVRGRQGAQGGRGRARGSAAPASAVTYLTIRPPGLSMGAFEVPVSGISLNGRMYVVVSTNHADDRSTDRSVLTKFSPPDSFDVLRTISERPAGRFIKMSLHAQTQPNLSGLPPGGPFIFMWGTSEYRKSDAYLAIVPAGSFESGRGTRYFAGLQGSVPTWSDHEADAVPVARNGTMGDVSVTWCTDPGVWLMTYDSRPPEVQGIEFAYSPTPWGPWSAPELIFNANRDGAFGTFIHDPRARPADGLAGPVIGQGNANPDAVRGGEYAPYVVERWTKRQVDRVTIYYVLSTWNPYVVVLMKSALHLEQAGPP